MKWKLVYTKDKEDLGPVVEYKGEESGIAVPDKTYETYSEANVFIQNNYLVGKVEPEVHEVSPKTYSKFDSFSLVAFAIFSGVMLGIIFYITL